jgi:hypothetical protein
MSDLLVPAADGSFVKQPPASVASLAKQILTALNKAYPDWIAGWKVAIDTEGGIVQVRNLLISGKMGFVMKITAIDPEMRQVVRYAGELLERYRISREKNIDVTDAVNNVKRNYSGEAIHED